MPGAPLRVHLATDAVAALAAAHAFLLAEPVRHNVLLSILEQRARRPEAARYWWVTDATGATVGFALYSPLTFNVVVGSMAPEVVRALVPEVAAASPDAPGVLGEAATAAAFAGGWAECRPAPVFPVEAQRIYRLRHVVPPPATPGELRAAGVADRVVLRRWVTAFFAETGVPGDAADVVDRHLGAGRFWVWDDGGPVSALAASTPAAGVSRVSYVYTPPERRGRGYAAAGVAALSERLLAEGATACMLFAQLHNPTPHALYRRVGYEAFAEVLSYRFGPPAGRRQ